VVSARALVLVAPRQLVAREVLVPAIGDEDGLLRVEACGLCGTDHEEFTGELFPGFSCRLNETVPSEAKVNSASA
jgi:alcohol dehydrogenase